MFNNFFHSCYTQPVSVLSTIGKNLDMGMQTDVMFLDMSKALEKVDYLTLLHKLNNIYYVYNIGINLG